MLDLLHNFIPGWEEPNLANEIKLFSALWASTMACTTVLLNLLTEEVLVEICTDSPTPGDCEPPGPAPDLMCHWGRLSLAVNDPRQESGVSLTQTSLFAHCKGLESWCAFESGRYGRKHSKYKSNTQKWSRGAQGDGFEGDTSQMQIRQEFSCFLSYLIIPHKLKHMRVKLRRCEILWDNR